MQIGINNNLPASTSDENFQDAVGLSQFGTPLFDDITFPAGNYFTLEGITVVYEELQLVSVRYVVQQQKNIVRTAISGRNGTVKEYNNTGDYVIRGQASISDLDPVFPVEQLRAFVDLKDVPQSVPIISKILNQSFGIDEVVVSSWSVDPGNGAGNVLINFSLESDTEFDLSQFIIAEV